MSGDPTAETHAAPSAAAATTDRRATVAFAASVGIAIVILALVVLVGADSPSIVARWVPTDTLLYGELRLDLPGDQRAELTTFVDRFPAFSEATDQSGPLGGLLDGFLDGGASDEEGQGDDPRSWFGGQLAVALGPRSIEARDGPTDGLTVATVTDEAAARGWLSARFGGAGDVAWEVTAGVALVGDPASVQEAVATGGSSSFASRPEVSTARHELGPGQVAFAFADGAAVAKLVDDAQGDLPLPEGIVTGDRLPAWIGAGLRFDDAAAIATTVTPHRSDLDIRNTDSIIPGLVPGTTIALLDVHDVGTRLASALGDLGEIGLDDELAGLLRTLGGVERLTSWIDEAAIVVDEGDEGAAIGLVVTSDEPNVPATLLEQLELAARISGGGVERTTHGTSTIVTVTLGDIGGLLGGLGGSSSLPLPIGRDASASWAIVDGHVIVSPDPRFVAEILDTRPETSLAASPTFGRLVAQAGGSGVGVGWLDIDRARELGDRHGSADRPSDRETGIDPLDAAVMVPAVGGTVDRATLVIGTDADR